MGQLYNCVWGGGGGSGGKNYLFDSLCMILFFMYSVHVSYAGSQTYNKIEKG